jgi:uncharacterized protein
MRLLTQILFLLVATSIVFGLHYYMYVRFVRDAGLSPGWDLGLTGLLVVMAIALPMSLAISRFVDGAGSRAMAWVAFSWMGAMAFAVSVLVISEVLRIPLVFSGMDPERRRTLGRMISIVGGGTALTMSGLAVRQALKALHVQKVSVTLKRLPPLLDGLKLVQVTDIHVGSTIRKDFVQKMVDGINALDPDVVCITGDLMDGSVEMLKEEMTPLAQIKSKHGVYFVTGNHEYYSGADDWIAHLTTLGIRVLRNERVSIGDDEASFDLAGVDDWTAHQFGNGHGADMKKALEGRDDSREVVLMAHQPKAAKEAAERGVGLQISGHTHAGQFWPWTYAVRLDSPYVRGLYEVGQTQVYVSPGTGYWGPPMRLGTQAEITEITLRSSMRLA